MAYFYKAHLSENPAIAAAQQKYCETAAAIMKKYSYGHTLPLSKNSAETIQGTTDYEVIQALSEEINSVTYAELVAAANTPVGTCVVIADGIAQTFPTMAEAWKYALDPSRVWKYNPQYPIVRKIGEDTSAGIMTIGDLIIGD